MLDFNVTVYVDGVHWRCVNVEKETDVNIINKAYCFEMVAWKSATKINESKYFFHEQLMKTSSGELSICLH